MKLPTWTEDELILTLYLYFEIKKGEKKNSKVVFTEMSRKLRKLNLFPEYQNNPTFRNINGISRKLGNFASVDPDYKGKGLHACSNKDREIFMRFYNKPSELTQAVELINSRYSDNTGNTKTQKRLSWTEEELILTLALYKTLTYGQMHGHNPKVIALSKILRNLPIHNHNIRPDNFRSVASVSLRLSNFRSCDPGCNAKGMRSSGTGLFSEVFNKYNKNNELLFERVNEIEHKYNTDIQSIINFTDPLQSNFVLESEDKETIFSLHKGKETDSSFYSKVREYHYGQSKVCSLCGHDPVRVYGRLGENILEYHCAKNFSRGTTPNVTIGDYVQICPTCHKLLDRYIGLVDYNDIMNLIE